MEQKKKALGKGLEELFSSENKHDFSQKLNEVNDLKEEYFKRLNQFYETLGDK